MERPTAAAAAQACGPVNFRTAKPTRALTTCPPSARIGTGAAEAEIPGANGAPPTFVPANLVAYNGKPFSGKAPTLIFIALLNGTPAAELDFSAKQQPSGPYGLAFEEIALRLHALAAQ